MARYAFMFFILLAVFELKCFPQIINKDDSLRSTVAKFGQARVKIPYPGRREADRISIEVSIIGVRESQIEISLSPASVNWVIHQNFNYSIIRPPARTILSASDIKKVLDWDVYPAYTQYDSIMQAFVTSYPSLCRLDTIGYSIYGKL